jgi:hypothetical protein
VRTINEKHSLLDIMFLSEFSEKRMSKNLGCGWLKRCLEQFVRVRINCRVQLVLLVIESDHGLVNRNVVRTLSILGL